MEAEGGGLLMVLEALQKRAVKRQLRKDLKTLKDKLEGDRNESHIPGPIDQLAFVLDRSYRYFRETPFHALR